MNEEQEKQIALLTTTINFTFFILVRVYKVKIDNVYILLIWRVSKGIGKINLLRKLLTGKF